MRAIGPGLAAAGALVLLGAGSVRGIEAPPGPGPDEPSIEEMLEAAERDEAGSREGAPEGAHEGVTKAPQPRSRTSKRKRKSSGLRGIILSDPKEQSGGRFTMEFDPASPLHRYDLVDHGLAARFVEIKAEIKLTNDGRWDRVFQLGDFTLKHLHRGGQRIEAAGKRLEKPHAIPTDCRRREGEGGGRSSRTYRVTAGPRGVAFQVDDGPVQAANVPWPGGRLIWPGHHQLVPSGLKLTGRLDPKWVSEMRTVAEDRRDFLAGKVVKLEPEARRTVRPEREPWRNCWSYGADTEVRRLLGWHEVGASWTVQDGVWVSPAPTDGREGWHSKIWPAALVSRDALLHFEARVDAGQLDLQIPAEYPGNPYRTNCEYVVIGPDGISLAQLSVFTSRPGARKVGRVSANSTVAPGRGKWRRYDVSLDGGSVKVLVDGAPALSGAVAPTGSLPMAFRVCAGSRVLLRKVLFRRIAGRERRPPSRRR
ncbi:MAG: hypothetical protein ACYS9X_03860 [Planctomycetota bacterium]|jgi:hypothetical protein